MDSTALRLISDAYRAQNAALLADGSGYGRGGVRHVWRLLAWARFLGARSILDYGCGQGRLRRALLHNGWTRPVFEYDPAIPAKAQAPKPADVVVCADVIEHIEPEHLDAVLAHLRALTRRGLFLVVAARPSNKHLPDGRNAHLIVQPVDWWVRRFRRAGFSVQRLRRHYRKHSDEQRGATIWLRPC